MIHSILQAFRYHSINARLTLLEAAASEKENKRTDRKVFLSGCSDSDIVKKKQ